MNNNDTSILQYLPSSTWSEVELQRFAEEYGSTGSKYLILRLQEILPEEAEAQLSALLKQQTTVADLVELYISFFPDLDEQITQFADDFRKEFLTTLYEQRLNSGEIKDQKFWKKALELLKNEEWTNLHRLIHPST